MIRPALRVATLAICAATLSGCISLLPKSNPAQLYRFGPTPAAGPASAPSSAVAVYLTTGRFQAESSDDRILTMEGGRAAYIAESRWVAPAEVLFDEELARAFDSSPVRLIARGQQGRFAYALRIDVRTFEARYDPGPKAAPQILVRVHAALTRSDQSSVGEDDFEASVPATENRVGSIVEAYTKATTQVIGKIVAWTEAKAT